MKSDLLNISNQTKGIPTPKGVPFVSIKDKMLGKKYDLSVSFLSPANQRKINRQYRGKDKTTNILSFTLGENSGEITFDLAQVKRDAPKFYMNYTKFLKFLFIHGCLHLKGWQHSSTMEKEEQKYLKIFE